RFVPTRGTAMERGVHLDAEALDDACPEQTERAQLGDLEEVAGADGERERHGIRLVFGEKLDAFGEREGEFLNGGGAGFFEAGGVDGDLFRRGLEDFPVAGGATGRD